MDTGPTFCRPLNVGTDIASVAKQLCNPRTFRELLAPGYTKLRGRRCVGR